MEKHTRVLFASGEIEPFAAVSEIASIARYLPQHLHDSGVCEVRIMMPRYGTISERRNRLHEVIRLCGSPIKMGGRTETLKVKVASIPGIRLQVYFMDNNRFFKRKGLHTDKQGVIFKDNAVRSLFFGRAVVQTVRNLRWKPDVVHAFGWMGGLLPMLVSKAAQEDALFQGTRVVYTPDNVEARATLTKGLIEKMHLPLNGENSGMSLRELGVRYANATAFPPSMSPDVLTDVPLNGYVRLSAEYPPMAEQALALYKH